MTSKEDIIRMARQAGILVPAYRDHIEHLERFAELVRADEREACAKVCDELFADVPPYSAPDCAAAIRARGQA